ncbi:MAG: hypothetical protein ACJAXX_002439 [Roseivirga sp.]|jgi:hypothetical protein
MAVTKEISVCRGMMGSAIARFCRVMSTALASSPFFGLNQLCVEVRDFCIVPSLKLQQHPNMGM